MVNSGISRIWLRPPQLASLKEAGGQGSGQGGARPLPSEAAPPARTPPASIERALCTCWHSLPHAASHCLTLPLLLPLVPLLMRPTPGVGPGSLSCLCWSDRRRPSSCSAGGVAAGGGKVRKTLQHGFRLPPCEMRCFGRLWGDAPESAGGIDGAGAGHPCGEGGGACVLRRSQAKMLQKWRALAPAQGGSCAEEAATLPCRGARGYHLINCVLMF